MCPANKAQIIDDPLGDSSTGLVCANKSFVPKANEMAANAFSEKRRDFVIAFLRPSLSLFLTQSASNIRP